MSGNNRNVLSTTVRDIINQTDLLQISMIFYVKEIYLK